MSSRMQQAGEYLTKILGIHEQKHWKGTAVEGVVGMASQMTPVWSAETEQDEKVSTDDPPYYDNVDVCGSLGLLLCLVAKATVSNRVFPSELFWDVAFTPKADELVATPHRSRLGSTCESGSISFSMGWNDPSP